MGVRHSIMKEDREVSCHSETMSQCCQRSKNTHFSQHSHPCVDAHIHYYYIIVDEIKVSSEIMWMEGMKWQESKNLRVNEYM